MGYSNVVVVFSIIQSVVSKCAIGRLVLLLDEK